ncbi:MAG: hypothetical protein ABI784_10620 [Ginsengibacter sp.]
MKKIKSIQLKAAFLLIVFSLNTIIGFACAVGLDMGFNSNHHEEELTAVSIHTHKDGKQHQHHNEVKNHHQEADNHLHKASNDEDNCCHDKVTQISQQDKAIALSISIISPVFFTALNSFFYNVDALVSNGADSHIKYLVRRHHPPIPDICVAIQSFQI